MNPWVLTAAYSFSLLGGQFLAREWVVLLKRQINKSYDPKSARLALLDWSVGFLERGIVTTLVIWAPSLTGPFVGGWMALKFAANWDKREVGGEFEAQQDVARSRLIGLVGSVVSLGVAIGAGVAAHPHSLLVWAN